MQRMIIAPDKKISNTALNDSPWYPPRFPSLLGCASEFHAYPSVSMYHSGNICDYPSPDRCAKDEMTKMSVKSAFTLSAPSDDEHSPAPADLPVFQLDNEVENLIILNSDGNEASEVERGPGLMKTSRSLVIPSPSSGNQSPSGLCTPEWEGSPRLRRHSAGVMNLRDFRAILTLPSKRSTSPNFGLSGALRAKVKVYNRSP